MQHTFVLPVAGRAKDRNGIEYHPFYSDDVPFHSLPCAVRIARPALCHGYWGCAAGLARWGAETAGNALWTQTLQAPQQTWQQAGAATGTQHAWQLWPGLPGEHGRETVSVAAVFTCRSNKRCCLSSNWLAGRASPATGCQEVPLSTASISFTLIVNKIARGTR